VLLEKLSNRHLDQWFSTFLALRPIIATQPTHYSPMTPIPKSNNANAIQLRVVLFKVF